MIRVFEVRVPITEARKDLREKVAEVLDIPRGEISSLKVVRRSIDARHKDKMIYFVYVVDIGLRKRNLEERLCASFPGRVREVEEERPFVVGEVPRTRRTTPIVVGSGPAGLFCALVLAMARIPPVVVERGKPIPKRERDVEVLNSAGVLNPDSNLAFGEGGAGAFSDGKLNTRISDPRVSFVYEKLIEAGAPESIRWEAVPHVGTDGIREISMNLVQTLKDMGVEFVYSSRVTDIVIEDGKACGVVAGGGKIKGYPVILAPGNGARDIFELLLRKGVRVEPKPFAVGIRIEHPKYVIRQAVYGRFARAKRLPPARYHLTYKYNGRAVYTFCMCPGGRVICSATEPDGVVVNGASDSTCSSPFSNSAIVVSVSPKDFPGGPLGGVAFQREMERKVFEVSGGMACVAQRLEDFFLRKTSVSLPDTTYRPGVVAANLWGVMPWKILEAIACAVKAWAKRLRGFDRGDAVLYAPETRTSSPVRIVRRETMEVIGVDGLYAAGEGSGYAGGIVSSAVDGIRVAEAVIYKVMGG